MRHMWAIRAGLWGATILTAALPLAAEPGRPFDLSVVTNGVSLEKYAARGRTYIEAVSGQPFSLRVSNPTSERVAVALSVDGRNVIDAKRTAAFDATKWVLEPGQTVEIPGWQISGETSRRFFFTQTASSYAKWLGDTSNVGTIEAVFFREKRCLPPIALQRPMTPRPRPQPMGDPEGAGASALDRPASSQAPGEAHESADAAPRPTDEAQSPKTRTDAGVSKGVARQRDEKDSFAATGIGERTQFPVRWIAFEEDPKPVARIALRYEFRRELVRLGVLPRPDDDLAARDRARGFSHEYAPDPDRPRAQ